MRTKRAGSEASRRSRTSPFLTSSGKGHFRRGVLRQRSGGSAAVRRGLAFSLLFLVLRHSQLHQFAKCLPTSREIPSGRECPGRMGVGGPLRPFPGREVDSAPTVRSALKVSNISDSSARICTRFRSTGRRQLEHRRGRTDLSWHAVGARRTSLVRCGRPGGDRFPSLVPYCRPNHRCTSQSISRITRRQTRDLR
jgi:hypothetical protein